MARLAAAGGDHEQQERPGAQQFEDAERRMLRAVPPLVSAVGSKSPNGTSRTMPISPT